MFIGIALFFVVIVMTIWKGRPGEGPQDIPWSETLTSPAENGWARRLDRIGFWVVVAILLIVIAYGPFFATYLPPKLFSPGFRIY